MSSAARSPGPPAAHPVPAGRTDGTLAAPPGQLCLGAVAAAHGVRGEVKLKCFTAEPEAIGAYGPLTTERGEVLRLAGLRRQGEVMVARIHGVTSREAAERLRGQKLYVPRGALPEPEGDEFYHADLLGLLVQDEAGQAVGRLVAIQDFGAGDLIEIALEAGGTAFLPFTRDLVPLVEPASGRVVIAPPADWLAEPEPDARAADQQAGEEPS